MVLNWMGRAPHGARGLKLVLVGHSTAIDCRAPHGARGLKPTIIPPKPWSSPVAPHTGRVD